MNFCPFAYPSPDADASQRRTALCAHSMSAPSPRSLSVTGAPLRHQIKRCVASTDRLRPLGHHQSQRLHLLRIPLVTTHTRRRHLLLSAPLEATTQTSDFAASPQAAASRCARRQLPCRGAYRCTAHRHESAPRVQLRPPTVAVVLQHFLLTGYLDDGVPFVREWRQQHAPMQSCCPKQLEIAASDRGYAASLS